MWTLIGKWWSIYDSFGDYTILYNASNIMWSLHNKRIPWTIHWGVLLHHPKYRIYGGFLKWGYPQLIYFNGILHYKPTTLGYPHWWTPPYRSSCARSHGSWQLRAHLWRWAADAEHGRIFRWEDGNTEVEEILHMENYGNICIKKKHRNS